MRSLKPARSKGSIAVSRMLRSAWVACTKAPSNLNTGSSVVCTLPKSLPHHRPLQRIL